MLGAAFFMVVRHGDFKRMKGWVHAIAVVAAAVDHQFTANGHSQCHSLAVALAVGGHGARPIGCCGHVVI